MKALIVEPTTCTVEVPEVTAGTTGLVTGLPETDTPSVPILVKVDDSMMALPPEMLTPAAVVPSIELSTNRTRP